MKQMLLAKRSTLQEILRLHKPLMELNHHLDLSGINFDSIVGFIPPTVITAFPATEIAHRDDSKSATDDYPEPSLEILN